jgi:hypothetical protein
MKRLREVANSPALHLVAYFLVLAAIMAGVWLVVPWFREVLVAPESTAGAAGSFETELGDAAARDLGARSVAETAVIGLLVLLGALVFTIPVVWIYTVIMRQEGYDRSFVRMLATLPVVVAGVVQVVRGDLALAFALAGIVAAVRFRTTVKDLQNAVFAFASIGIGLASGTGSFVLAGAIATVFCLLAFALWRLNIGDVEPSLELSHGGVGLAEALVPGETHRAIVIGDTSVVEPVHAEDLPALSTAIDRLSDYVRADALRKKKKYNTLLLVYTERPDEAEAHVDSVLDDHTSRWVQVDTIARNDEGLVALEYLLRLKKSVKVGRMIDQLRSGDDGPICAAELKPIQGLRKRLT